MVDSLWRRQWHPTPALLPGKSHGWGSLVGCCPWGCEESDTTKRLHFQFSLSCIGEGNGNPLQCSCLENPRDWGAWWAAVYGVAQSRTWLKRLSSSSRLTLTANVAWVTINVRLHHSLCQKLKQEAKPPFPHKSALGMLCSSSSIFHALTQCRGKCLILESVTVRCKAPTSLSLGSDWSAMW